MPAKNDRIWHDEVAKIIQFERQGDVITLHNVRNFRWYDTDKYDIHWETCEYRPSELESFDVIISECGLKKSCIQWQVLALKMGANLAFPLKFAKSRTRVFRRLVDFSSI